MIFVIYITEEHAKILSKLVYTQQKPEHNIICNFIQYDWCHSTFSCCPNSATVGSCKSDLLHRLTPTNHVWHGIYWGIWTSRKYANSLTSQLADWTNRGLDSLQTSQVAFWSTHGLSTRGCCYQH